MQRKLYPSDLTDKQWTILAPLIPAAKTGGRPRQVNLREVLNGIFYILCGGCTAAHDTTRFSGVEDSLSLLSFEASSGCLATDESGATGESPSTSRAELKSATIVDSQSVKMTEVAGEVGYDGAKLVKGHKRHLLVDTLGLLLQVIVSAANVSEKAGALLILEKIVGQFPRLVKVFADGGYEGKDFMQKVKDDHLLELEVVKRKQSKGFQVLP